MEINEAIKICLFNGIKVYPQFDGQSFVIAIEEKTKPIKLSKKHYTSKSINYAVAFTYIFIARKIKAKI
ncbi:hypothetical protein [Nonlabens xiamenensis]|uniref:hypothetical protein n=1 Tax=Nonlabens xiamenensis TaxID=2341043 RepID=UPI000F6073C6|nr:hypothetical protein [Nonlabens xiamenensis]